MVGGLGARAHGARRPTGDIDFVPRISDDNFERLAAALRELGARLRVGGMTDDEARQLPVRVDGATLRSFGSSTWTTDAGAVDILRELPDSTGRRRTFDELAARGVVAEIGGFVVRVAALDDIVAAKEFAGRDKDNEALPELRDLRRADSYPTKAWGSTCRHGRVSIRAICSPGTHSSSSADIPICAAR